MKRLQCLQNKAARVIFMKRRRHSASPLLSKLHWLPISQRIDYKICVHVYKSLIFMSPPYIHNRLQHYVPSRTFRSAFQKRLVTRKSKTRAGDRCFATAAPNVWNSLPSTVKQATSIANFNTLFKTHLYHCVIYSNQPTEMTKTILQVSLGSSKLIF
jgi:hypothetical protein